MKIRPFKNKISHRPVFHQTQMWEMRNWTIYPWCLCFSGRRTRPAESPDENRLSCWTEEKTITKTAVFLCEGPTVDGQWSLSPRGLVKGPLVGALSVRRLLCHCVIGNSLFGCITLFNNLLYSYHGVMLASRLSWDTLRAAPFKWTFSHLYFSQRTGLIKQMWRPHFSIFLISPH